MSENLNKMAPAELRAALKGGTHLWGEWGSSDHVRYSKPVDPKSRRLCRCSCKRRATHLGMANGVALKMGCEFSVARWVRDPRASLRSPGQGGE